MSQQYRMHYNTYNFRIYRLSLDKLYSMMTNFKRFSLILGPLIFLLLLYLLLNSSMKYSKFWTILQSDLNYYDFLEDNMTQSFQRNYMLNRNIDNDCKFLYPYRNGFIRAKWSFLKDFDNILAGLNLLNDDYDMLSNGFAEEISLKDNYVFVTAFSDNHFREALYLLKSMMQVYGNETVFTIYNIGLSEANIMRLRSNYTPIIREIINFQFSNYPQHVKNLDNFSWKPLIIAQEMKKHPGDNLVWMDTSTMINKRLPNPKYLMAKFENFTKDHGSWLLIDYTGHNILAATNPKMYNFLPLPKKLAYGCPMFGANIQILFAGSDSSSNRFVAKWWVRCALEQTCIAPYNSHLLCEFQKQGGQLDKFNYANCHRYDQSALNILLSWVNGFDSSRYSDMHQIFKDSFAVERRIDFLAFMSDH